MRADRRLRLSRQLSLQRCRRLFSPSAPSKGGQALSASYLLDTNICLYIRRERPHHVLGRFRAQSPGSVAMSVITYGELAYGVQKSPDPQQASTLLDELAALIPVLALSNAAASAYGRIRSDLAVKGALIGNNDLWIAAHALSLGVTLVTNNEREFQRVEGLSLENWALSPVVRSHNF